MCEFKVYLNGEKVAEDIIFAEANLSGVIIKDIMGVTRSYSKVKISEVNVVSQRLLLEG